MQRTVPVDWWRPAAATTVTAPAIKLTPILLGLYLAMHLVPVSEILVLYAGIRFPLVATVGLILTAALASGGLVGRFWKTSIAEPWMALLVLFVLAAIFGHYPRRSVPFMLEIGARFFLLPFYCCAMAVSPRRVRHLLFCVAGATIAVLVLSLLYGHTVDGRLLGMPRTDLENPNDLAFAILFGMPSLFLLLQSRHPVARLLWLGAFLLSVLYILKTGSRANFVTLLIVAATAFLLVPGRARITMLVATAGLAVVMVAMVPAQTWRRLTLIVLDPSQTVVPTQLQGALASQAARTTLQERAVALSSRHVMFGVGPLMFADAVDAMVKQETGRRSSWQGAHNTYLEIAAENGLPALMLYVWIVASCLVMNYRVYRICRTVASQADNAPQALCLVLMTVVFAVGVAFSNSAYAPYLFVLVGLGAANSLAIRESATVPEAC